MNHSVITNWLVVIVAVIGMLATSIYYVANMTGKISMLENDLNNTMNRVDGLYVLLAQKGVDVKKAILSSDLDAAAKQRIVNSLLPNKGQPNVVPQK